MGLGDFEMSFDYTAIERTDQDEPSSSYPNLRTVYRKEIVPCRLVASSPEALKRIGIGIEGSVAFTAKVDTRSLSCMWLTQDQCVAHDIQMFAPAASSDFSALVYPPVGYQEEELNEFLIAGGIPLDQWGAGNNKTLSEFSEELIKGEAVLVKGADGKIVREVNAVILKVFREDRNEILVEAAETTSGTTDTRERLPGLKKLNGEHPFWAARRLVSQYLKIPSHMVEIDTTSVQAMQEMQDSTSYAGVQTLYRKILITANLRAA